VPRRAGAIAVAGQCVCIPGAAGADDDGLVELNETAGVMSENKKASR
jgi:hypothetical protein